MWVWVDIGIGQIKHKTPVLGTSMDIGDIPLQGGYRYIQLYYTITGEYSTITGPGYIQLYYTITGEYSTITGGYRYIQLYYTITGEYSTITGGRVIGGYSTITGGLLFHHYRGVIIIYLGGYSTMFIGGYSTPLQASLQGAGHSAAGYTTSCHSQNNYNHFIKMVAAQMLY